MNNVFGLNYYVFCILVLIVVLYFTKNVRDEGFFGMSPGTMDQLSSTHASTMNDVVENAVQASLIQRGISQMTESGYGDQHEAFENSRKEKENEQEDPMLKDLYDSMNLTMQA